MRIAIVACNRHPELSASNSLFRRALERRGADVEVVAWNRAPSARMSEYSLCVFRQSWDYQDDPAGFAAWVCNARRAGARLANDADIVVWNNDKRTLASLQEIGIEVPWMVGISGSDELPISELPDRVVIKPAFGGSGVGVRLCERNSVIETLAEARREAPGRPFLAQEFLPEIVEGEWSLTFVQGSVTHGVCKRPAANEFRVNGRFQPTIERVEPPAPMLVAAQKLGRHLGPGTLYARLDGVLRGDRFVCTELELTDPDLHFEWCEEGADMLAIASIDRARSGAAVRA